MTITAEAGTVRPSPTGPVSCDWPYASVRFGVSIHRLWWSCLYWDRASCRYRLTGRPWRVWNGPLRTLCPVDCCGRHPRQMIVSARGTFEKRPTCSVWHELSGRIAIWQAANVCTSDWRMVRTTSPRILAAVWHNVYSACCIRVLQQLREGAWDILCSVIGVYSAFSIGRKQYFQPIFVTCVLRTYVQNAITCMFC